MIPRTDLAIESCEINPHKKDIQKNEYNDGDIKVTEINILTDTAAESVGKRRGRYVTIEMQKTMNNSTEENAHTVLCRELSRLIPENGGVMVIGLGNDKITADALGPETADRIFATRHISAELAKSIGLDGLRSVSVLSPGVLGQTGIESHEIIKSAAERISPSCVIAVDALAARDLERLGCTVQLSDTGITPGSGVGNSRREISRETLGVPVISVGVPTVVDAATLVYELTGKEDVSGNGMVVTQREIDSLTERASKLIGHAINCVLQPSVPPQTLLSLV